MTPPRQIDRYHYYHFTNKKKKIEDQKSQVTRPRTQVRLEAGFGIWDMCAFKLQPSS